MQSKSPSAVGGQSAPNFSPDERAHLREAFQGTLALFFTGNGELPSPDDLVFRVLRETMLTMQFLPDIARNRLRQPSWRWQFAAPEDEKIAMSELVKFLTSEADLSGCARRRRAVRVSPRDMSVAETVLNAFARVIVGKNPVRDWRTLYRLASGMTALEVAVEIKRKVTKQQIYKDRDRQCAAIARRLADFMPNEIHFHAGDRNEVVHEVVDSDPV
jgi:hypothetical protein